MTYYVVIDTNVLVSVALKHDSVPGTIIDLAFDGPITPVLNEEIEREYREVLSRPKFHLTKEIVDAIIIEFRKRGVYIGEAEGETIEWNLPDPKDKVFYEVVMEERKTEDAWLVTRNIDLSPVPPCLIISF